MENRNLQIPGYVPAKKAVIAKPFQETIFSYEDSQFHQFRFYGLASEYFGIWVSNISLNIMTFGIYSAWAKVRRKRYFYGNTELNGYRFDYHAKGWQILIGRIITFIILTVYSALSHLSSALAFAMLIFTLCLAPYLIMRGIRFNARVTSYRNVCFDFTGGYGGAFLAFIAGPILSVLSLTMLQPVATRWQHTYLYDNLKYGSGSFKVNIKLPSLYGALLKCSLVVIPGLIIIAIFIFTMMRFRLEAGYQNYANTDPRNAPIAMLSLGFYVFFYAWLLIIFAVYRALIRNIVLSSVVFNDTDPMESDVDITHYFWILLSNIILTILTFSLMRPWCAIRISRYLCEHTAIRFSGEWKNFYKENEEEGSAVGSEYIDFEGVDFGF